MPAERPLGAEILGPGAGELGGLAGRVTPLPPPPVRPFVVMTTLPVVVTLLLAPGGRGASKWSTGLTSFHL